MRLKDYLHANLGKESLPVSMQELLNPFGFQYKGDRDDKLNMGLVLENLETEFNRNDWIDPIDVATSALTLGYNDADPFLDEAPWLIVQANQNGGDYVS